MAEKQKKMLLLLLFIYLAFTLSLCEREERRAVARRRNHRKSFNRARVVLCRGACSEPHFGLTSLKLLVKQQREGAKQYTHVLLSKAEPAR